jgi:uncharacterized protein YhbP (UPF0306 family)
MSDEAREIVEASHYLILGTADAEGRPWACPVWYAHDAYAVFFWASRPGARHSVNIGVRPAVSAVIFDSSKPPGDGQAVYLEAVAEEVVEDLEAAVAVYSGRSVARGLGQWSVARLTEPAQHRLYRARVTGSYVLDGHDRRVSVEL